MVAPALVKDRRQPSPVQAGKPCLLIISDSPERMARLRSSLAVGEVEISSVSSTEEMCFGCRRGYDMVVVDVRSESISGVLKVLRECQGCTKIPILVDATRLTDDPRLAGLLPQYRAMPCSYSEMITLTRRQLAPHSEERRTWGIF